MTERIYEVVGTLVRLNHGTRTLKLKLNAGTFTTIQLSDKLWAYALKKHAEGDILKIELNGAKSISTLQTPLFEGMAMTQEETEND